MNHKLVLLHVAHLDGDPFSGVNVAVAQHVIAQQDLTPVGFLNLSNIPIPGVKNQFSYTGRPDLSALPEPFHAPDFVVFHEVYRPAFLPISATLRKRGIPYLVIPHGSLTKYAQKQKRLKKAAANVLLFKPFIERAAAVQYLSAAEANNSWPVPRQVIQPNGVALQADHTAVSHATINLCYIGRLDIKIKGLDLLIAAANLLRHTMAEYHAEIHIYGCDVNGSAGVLKEMIQQSGLAQIVRLHGAVRDAQKLEALRRSDCFIQPSRSEGMPMGVLEALGMGVPCLVSNVSGLADDIQQEKAGWVCSPDVKELAACIREVLSASKESDRRTQALALANQYAWPVVAKKTLDAYEEIIADSAAGGSHSEKGNRCF